MTEQERYFIATFVIASLTAWDGTQYQSLFYIIVVTMGGLNGLSWYVASFTVLVVKAIVLLWRGVFRAAGG